MSFQRENSNCLRTGVHLKILYGVISTYLRRSRSGEIMTSGSDYIKAKYLYGVFGDLILLVYWHNDNIYLIKSSPRYVVITPYKNFQCTPIRGPFEFGAQNIICWILLGTLYALQPDICFVLSGTAVHVKSRTILVALSQEISFLPRSMINI